MRGPKLHVVTSSVVVPSQCSMRLKIRYVITALVLLWLVVAVIYLFPFVFMSREPPSVVSSVLFHNPCTSRASDLRESLNNPDYFPQTCMIYGTWIFHMDFSYFQYIQCTELAQHNCTRFFVKFAHLGTLCIRNTCIYISAYSNYTLLWVAPLLHTMCVCQ